MTEILVFLNNFEPRSRTEIYQMISTSPHMADKLECLADEGLITTFNVEGSRKILQKLTPLGKEIASDLQKIEETTGGNIDGYRSEMMMNLLRFTTDQSPF